MNRGALIAVGACAGVGFWIAANGGTAAQTIQDAASSAADTITNAIGDFMPYSIAIGLAKNQDYINALNAAERKYAIPQNMLVAQAYTESRFNPSARSPVGAAGIMQFMPATAAEFGIDPLDPFASIDAAGRYMAQLFRMTGTWALALAAYNWGVGNVQRKGVSAAPLETRNYVAQITNLSGMAA